MQNLKCVVVGDGSVGKTCMILNFCSNSFSYEHIPTVFDHYACNFMINKSPVNLAILDTAGQDDFDKLGNIHMITLMFVCCAFL